MPYTLMLMSHVVKLFLCSYYCYLYLIIFFRFSFFIGSFYVRLPPTFSYVPSNIITFFIEFNWNWVHAKLYPGAVLLKWVQVKQKVFGGVRTLCAVLSMNCYILLSLKAFIGRHILPETPAFTYIQSRIVCSTLTVVGLTEMNWLILHCVILLP